MAHFIKAAPPFEPFTAVEQIRRGEIIDTQTGSPIPSPTIGFSVRKSELHGKIPPLLFGISFTACSADFRKLIEELEPDTHQFIEVPVEDSDGSVTDEVIYILNPLVRVDAIDIDASYGVKTLEALDGSTYQSFTNFSNPDVRLDRMKISKNHLWIGKKQFRRYGYLFISDALFQRICSSDLEALETFPIREV